MKFRGLVITALALAILAAASLWLLSRDEPAKPIAHADVIAPPALEAPSPRYAPAHAAPMIAQQRAEDAAITRAPSRDGELDVLVWDDSMHPVQGANVTIDDARGHRVLPATDVTGHARGIVAGHFLASIDAPDLYAGPRSGEAIAGSTVRLTLLTSTAFGDVLATVSDADGKAISGRTVVVGEAAAVTDEAGLARIRVAAQRSAIARVGAMKSAPFDVSARAEIRISIQLAREDGGG